MHKSEVYAQPHEVVRALSQFDVTIEDLIAVALQASLARSEASPLHPQNASGQYSYLAGVAALRAVFLQKRGWKMSRPNNAEAIVNERLGIVILFQNVDHACGAHDPNPISSKGPGVADLVDNPTGFLWDYMEKEAESNENVSVWFFCVASNGDEVSAELSRPRAIQGNGRFGTFAERIFVLQGYSSGPNVGPNTEENPSDLGTNTEFDVSVTRKN